MKIQTKIAMTACLLIGILFATNNVNAQVKIGGTNNTVDNRSILELESDSLALRVTRLSTTQRDAVFSWEQGHVIFNTTDNCFQFYDGTKWVCVGKDTTITNTIFVGDTLATDGGIQESWMEACGCGKIMDITGKGTSSSVGQGRPLDSIMTKTCGVKLEGRKDSVSYLLGDPEDYEGQVFCFVVDVSDITKTQDGYVLLNAGKADQIAIIVMRNNDKWIEIITHSSIKLIDQSRTGILAFTIRSWKGYWLIEYK